MPITCDLCGRTYKSNKTYRQHPCEQERLDRIAAETLRSMRKYIHALIDAASEALERAVDHAE